MKRCPTCNRTYEDDALSFCPSDGSSLVKDEPAAPASFDPQATILATPPANTYTPPSFADQPPANDWGAQQQQQQGGYPASQPLAAQGWGGGIPQQQQMPPPPMYPVAATKQQGFAIGSLVCGITSIVCCLGLLTGIPAIVLGYIAMNKEKTDPARFGGKGMAMAGLILGILGTIFGTLGVILQIAQRF